MLKKLPYSVPLNVLEKSKYFLPDIDFKISLNSPSGRFFYDPWHTKEEFKNTIWENILETLPYNIGEARLICLEHGSCYHSHADIDDRFHLTITGEHCYLIDIDKEEMHKSKLNGSWYIMDAGRRHSASNFSNTNRIQLVVRKLLDNNILKNPVNIKIKTTHTDLHLARYEFDNTVSLWLNKANKEQIISNFEKSQQEIKLDIEKEKIADLTEILPGNFFLELI